MERVMHSGYTYEAVKSYTISAQRLATNEEAREALRQRGVEPSSMPGKSRPWIDEAFAQKVYAEHKRTGKPYVEVWAQLGSPR